MINIAICGEMPFSAESMAGLITRCAQHLALPIPEPQFFATSFTLLEHLDNPAAEPLFDLIILQAASSGLSPLQTAQDARKSGYDGEIILIEDTAKHALGACRAQATGYLVSPIGESNLEAEISASIARLAKLDAESITMRMRGGVKRIPFARLVFAQTSNHDQVLHMRDGSTMQLRCSSHDLFDRLSHDARFLKLGSSYIVNLDLVSSLNSNGETLMFVDRSTASVPVRFRKVVQDALFARAEWRKRA